MFFFISPDSIFVGTLAIWWNLRCVSAPSKYYFFKQIKKMKQWKNIERKRSHKTNISSICGCSQRLMQTKKHVDKANWKWLKVLRWIFSSRHLNIITTVLNWHKIPVRFCVEKKIIRIPRPYRDESSQLNQFNAIHLIGFDDRTSLNLLNRGKDKADQNSEC